MTGAARSRGGKANPASCRPGRPRAVPRGPRVSRRAPPALPGSGGTAATRGALRGLGSGRRHHPARAEGAEPERHVPPRPAHDLPGSLIQAPLHLATHSRCAGPRPRLSRPSPLPRERGPAPPPAPQTGQAPAHCPLPGGCPRQGPGRGLSVGPLGTPGPGAETCGPGTWLVPWNLGGVGTGRPLVEEYGMTAKGQPAGAQPEGAEGLGATDGQGWGLGGQGAPDQPLTCRAVDGDPAGQNHRGPDLGAWGCAHTGCLRLPVIAITRPR